VTDLDDHDDDASDDDEDLGSVADWPSLLAMRRQAARLDSLRSPRVTFERDGMPIRSRHPYRWLTEPAV
jgi:hypothetical protein